MFLNLFCPRLGLGANDRFYWRFYWHELLRQWTGSLFTSTSNCDVIDGFCFKKVYLTFMLFMQKLLHMYSLGNCTYISRIYDFPSSLIDFCCSLQSQPGSCKNQGLSLVISWFLLLWVRLMQLLFFSPFYLNENIYASANYFRPSNGVNSHRRPAPNPTNPLILWVTEMGLGIGGFVTIIPNVGGFMEFTPYFMCT